MSSRFPTSATFSAIILFLCTSISFAQDSAGANTAQGWTTSSQQGSVSGTMNPIRTRETHSESNGRTVDKRIMERLGPDARYVPYLEIEKETTQVDANTVRTVERTFGNGPNGEKALVQVQEGELRKLPGGEEKLTRSTSNPDANGRLQVVQREVRDSRETRPGTREIHTTFFTASTNGGLAPSMKIEESEKQEGDTTSYKRSTLLPDLSGRWTVGEIREGTVTGQVGQPQTKQERVLRPNADGKLAVIEKTVSHETPSTAGEKRSSTETYSSNVPGTTEDGKLHLVKRETNVQRQDSNGRQSTVQQVEGLNPGDPGVGLRVQSKTVDISQPEANGKTQQQRTVFVTDTSGNSRAVWVDIGKSDKPSAVQVDTKPADKPK